MMQVKGFERKPYKTCESYNGVPTIVMVDMNDCVSNQVNTKLNIVMSSHGYSQLVQSPTTDCGTLIDHV